MVVYVENYMCLLFIGILVGVRVNSGNKFEYFHFVYLKNLKTIQ